MTAPKEDPTVARGKEHGRNTIAQLFAKSNIADRVGEYPKFDKKELNLGKVLGKGGFATVFEIRSFALDGVKVQMNKKGFSDDLDETEYFFGNDGNREKDARMFIAQHCLRNNSDARYAVKLLSPEVVANKGMFIQGMIDMALETRFMSDIEHPNIVKIRAMAQCDPFNEKYFILMDRLYDTLERRIEKVWLPKSKRQNGFLGKRVFDRKGAKRDALYEERIVYAFDLAAAVAYLHSRQILYRDLKPENIGFDCRGDIKLFDFGLAKELNDNLKTSDGLYNLTGDTGSPRYMAPEVALGKPYNGTCDTYSFCLLLWQMLALTTPFEVYTVKRLKERVWSSMEKRPLVGDSWPTSIKLLLKRGWANDVSNRFTMAQVEGTLKKECIRLRDGDSNGLEHQRRRSTFVFRGSKSGVQGGTMPVGESIVKNSMPAKNSIPAKSHGNEPLTSKSEHTALAKDYSACISCDV